MSQPPTIQFLFVEFSSSGIFGAFPNDVIVVSVLICIITAISLFYIQSSTKLDAKNSSDTPLPSTPSRAMSEVKDTKEWNNHSPTISKEVEPNVDPSSPKPQKKRLSQGPEILGSIMSPEGRRSARARKAPERLVS